MLNAELPFDWQLRLSKRAKRPRITISPHGLVELVWPHRMSKRHINPMLSEHKLWVVKQLGSIDVQESVVQPPEMIDFKATGQMFDVNYVQCDGRLYLQEQGNKLELFGDIQDKEALSYVLTAWVKRKGKEVLSPWLDDVAQDMGLTYEQVSIRLQKKRWGSCSTQRHINLNAALLFMPDYLVRHVLIHELTHLTHHNHSARFWSAV
ncbi:MAG: DUF45 domain-containing protein, partial [Ghiorsea sp.]|nr:DUF45 domain-containing protein [Ghiorsea sp.]